MPTKPRIGIIGNGSVGSNLGKGLERAGYLVQTVGKEPKRVKDVATQADIVVLAVPAPERKNALSEMGDAYRGKTLVDVSNLMTPKMEYAASLEKSGAEELQEWARGAKVVKAFNTVFASTMATGRAHGEPLTVLAAGDDARAKEQVLTMARDIGFDAVDAGPLSNARWLETFGLLNIALGFGQKMGPDIGFRLVRGDGQMRTPMSAGSRSAR